MKRVVYITGMVLGERRERGNLLTDGERERAGGSDGLSKRKGKNSSE